MKGKHTMTNPDGAIPKRPFGDTGIELSVIAFGGIVVTGAPQEQADRIVAEAVERGVNYFDVAPSYGDAEERLGPALEPYRKDIFLACKTGQRQRKAAEEEFEHSLKRLRTDYFDLYQIHGLVDVNRDIDPVFARGSIMDMLAERQRAGQIRYLGFSAHTQEAALLAMECYDFDSILFPVNFATWMKNGFGPQVLEKAEGKGMARLALKAMACQKWADDDPTRKQYAQCWYQPLTDPRLASMALRWTLSQPITAAVPPGEVSLFRLAMGIASADLTLTPEEQTELRTLAQELNPIFPTP
jgi:aryl-alcohol dehydrogenase-like predicted oxidoreductase